MRTTRRNLDAVLWSDALADCIETVRERVAGDGPPTRFGVEGVFFDTGVKLVVYGEINASTIPRLETVLEGLLMLHPKRVTVELTEPLGFAPEIRRWMAAREDGVVAFLARPNPVLTAPLLASQILDSEREADPIGA